MAAQDQLPESATQISEQGETEAVDSYGKATWGPWLLRGVFLASMIYAWWLVIYDHGVVSHH